MRTGDLFDVDDGPGEDLQIVRGISSFQNWGNEASEPSGFNDRGQIAFGAHFEDPASGELSSGVFVTDRVAVRPGDYDFDGTVDAADYTIWRNGVGEEGDGLAADGDGNGKIDQGDYALWKLHFGESDAVGSTEIVPEPSGGLTLTSLLLSLQVRKRRR